MSKKPVGKATPRKSPPPSMRGISEDKVMQRLKVATEKKYAAGIRKATRLEGGRTVKASTKLPPPVRISARARPTRTIKGI